jgi:predicted phosphoribosyltransferase
MSERLRIDPSGRTAIVVDDGLATGATMKAALIALKRQGAEKIVVALPVAPVQALDEIAELADNVVCLLSARHFRGVVASWRRGVVASWRFTETFTS